MNPLHPAGLDAGGSARLARMHEAVGRHLATDPTARDLPHMVLEEVVEGLCGVLGALWRSEAGGQPACVGVHHRPGAAEAALEMALRSRRLREGDGAAPAAFDAREPRWASIGGASSLLPATPGAKRVAPAGGARAIHGRSCGAGHILAVPLIHGGDCDGVLEMMLPGDGPPAPETVGALTVAAASLALALRYGSAASALDAGDRDHAELSALEEGFAALDEGVLIQDAAGAVIAANPAIGRIMAGLGVDELTARYPTRPFVQASYEDGTPLTRENAPWSRTLASGEPVRDACIRFTRPDGRTVWVEVRCQPLHRAGEPRPYGVVSSYQDVTDRRSAEEQITYLAYHDSLTGLPNRALLAEHLALALARARRNETAVALLFVDLDDFKLVNDSLGHHVGDRVLREVAERLNDVTRATDLLARQGGDEFLLLLSDLPLHAAASTAEKVAANAIAALGPPFHVDDAEFHVGASIGISVHPDDADDAEELLQHADAAMYGAKRGGGGRAFWAPAAADPLERLSLTARLRRALDEGELALWYQPIFELGDGAALTGVEALLRWNDPERGLILPGEFVSLAEDTGLIEPIGEWVIDRACSQARIWAAQGIAVHLDFNVSPRQLMRPDVARVLAAGIAEHGVDPDLLTVEITETAAMHDRERSEPVLQMMRDLGVRVAIDDFGAGYSSLGRLREMPVQTLKIDRALLEGVPDRADARAIIEAIVRLSEGLGMTVVAEGIETPAQRDYLAGLGCELGQGFHLGRPVPEAEITRMLLAGAQGLPVVP